MRIESLHIKNYRALRDFRLGGVAWDSPPGQPLSNLVVVVGRNGSGKSTHLRCFRFPEGLAGRERAGCSGKAWRLQGAMQQGILRSDFV